MAVWIDESGVLVRPAEQAAIERSPLRDVEIPPDTPERLRRHARAGQGHQRPVGRLPGGDRRLGRARRRQPLRPRPRRGHRPLGRPLGRPRPGGGVLRARPAPVAHGGSTTPPCRGGARRTGCSPRTGRTSARRGRLVTTPDGADSDLIQGPNDVYEGNWLDDVLAAGGGAEYYRDGEPGLTGCATNIRSLASGHVALAHGRGRAARRAVRRRGDRRAPRRAGRVPGPRVLPRPLPHHHQPGAGGEPHAVPPHHQRLSRLQPRLRVLLRPPHPPLPRVRHRATTSTARSS